MNAHYTYLLINVLSVLFPLLFSFHPAIRFHRQWKIVFPSLLLTASFFLVWDFFFTQWGIWSFNQQYVTGIMLAGMPVEEWMFFFCIPYACMFIYHCLNILYPKTFFDSLSGFLNMTVLAICITAMIFFYHCMYTFTTSFFCAALILALITRGHTAFMGKFYRAFLISKIPFLLVNGVLTMLPVVIYNNSENTGLRILSIPAEDVFYSLTMLLMNISLMEYFRSKLRSGMVPV